MIFVIVAAIVLALVAGPSLWVRAVMRRYSAPADRYSGTGAELVTHLARDQGLDWLRVERTQAGDHYDPDAGVVRLTPDKYDGRSLTAITVAGHEVGHALQDRDGYRPLRWRTRMARSVRGLERLGAVLMFGAPVLAVVTRVPTVAALSVLGGWLSLGAGVLVHAVTLPTELDASFARALPLLERRVLYPVDRPHARRLLTAAALTYVSAALLSLINVARWWALLRR